jgi:hypothetical protein
VGALLQIVGKCSVEGCDAGSANRYSSGSEDAGGDFASGKDSEQGHETLRQTFWDYSGSGFVATG